MGNKDRMYSITKNNGNFNESLHKGYLFMVFVLRKNNEIDDDRYHDKFYQQK